MDLIKVTEGHNRIVRIRLSGKGIHRLEQSPQFRFLLHLDRSHYQQMRLRSHRKEQSFAAAPSGYERERSGLSRCGSAKLQTKMNQQFFPPIDPTEIEVWPNQPDFVTNPVGDHRGFGVVKDNALLVIEPTGGRVDLGNDGADSKDRDSVPHDSFGFVKGLSLPPAYVAEFRDFLTELGARSANRRPLRSSVG